MNKEAEEQAVRDEFKKFIGEKVNVEGIDLVNKALLALAESAFLSGAKYATERIQKIFKETFLDKTGGIPFPKL